MAWDNGSQDKANRVRTAIELGRQDFWKSVYVAATEAGHGAFVCEEKANRALLDFDMKFKGTTS